MRFEETIPGLRQGKLYFRREGRDLVRLGVSLGHLCVLAQHRGE